MKYEIILFDADETLFDFHRSEKHAFEQTVKVFGIQYDEFSHLKAYQEINSAIWKEFEEGRISQGVLKVERFKRLAVRLQEDFNPVDFARSYEEALGNACFLFDGSTELVEGLHGKYRLAIITNGLKSVQENRIAKAPIARCFETIVISESAGVSKPDPRIFELALLRLGHSDRDTVLMVGDSLTSDIRGGLGFGIDTCWYNPARKENMTGIRPTYEIAVLADLWKVLG
jgi:2-haloacid dehalogenase